MAGAPTLRTIVELGPAAQTPTVAAPALGADRSALRRLQTPPPPKRQPARVDPGTLERVLAVRLDNIGDMVMLGPALRALRAAIPAGRLTLLASAAGAQVAPLLPWVDDVIETQALWQDAAGWLPLDPERELRLVEQLAARRFDAAFVFTSFSQTPFPPAYACYLAGIPVRVGQTADFGGAVLSHPVPPLATSAHQVERNLHLVETCGIPVPDRTLALAVPPATQAGVRSLLRPARVGAGEPGHEYVVLAPGASCSARRLPGDRFATIAAALERRLGWPAVVLGKRGEEHLAEAILVQTRHATSLVGRTSVAEAAAVVAGAGLVVTAHSAALHFADAFRVPVVCLFSGTDEETQWAPRSAPAALLREPTACAPCRLFECPYGLPCLDIPTEQVISAALDVLEAAQSPMEERWSLSAS